MPRPLLALAPLIATVIPMPVTAQNVSAEYNREARDLAAHPAIVNAFSAIEDMDDWALEHLVELTEIPAPPFMEEARGRRFAELLTEYGADSVWTDAEGNVIGLRRGRRGDRTIGFGGHLDTVFPEGTDVTVRQRGDTIFAPGVGDDTRGLVVVLAVLRAMEEAGIETDSDVHFVGVVGEEGVGDLRGMKHMFRDPASAPDAWIEVDGGGLMRLVTDGLGSFRYRVTFKGPGGHSWGRFRARQPRPRHEPRRPPLPGHGRHANPEWPPHELQRRAHRRRYLGQRHPVRKLDGGRHALDQPREPGAHRTGVSRRDGPGARRGKMRSGAKDPR